MSPLSRSPGVRLLPNLGAEEGSVPPAALDKAAPRTVRRLWRLLFASTATEIEMTDPAPWPPELGPPPDRPAFAGLENDGGLVPWLSTPEAQQRAEQSGLAYAAARPLTTAQLHDKGFAQRLARKHGALPDCLVPCVDVLDPEELDEPVRAFRAIEDRLRNWPTWALQSFVLKPRYGFNGRGRVGYDADSWRQSSPAALRSAALRLAKRGGAVLEPWLQRRGDFCTQWFIGERDESRLLGSLEQIVSPAGFCQGHRGRIDSRGRVGSGRPPDETLRESSILAAEAAQQAGYRGPLGVDSFTFLEPQDRGRELVRPLVEINARFSVGCIALGIVRRAFEAHKTRLGLEPGTQRSFYIGLDAPPGGWPRARAAAGEDALWLPLDSEAGGPSPGLLFAPSPESIDRALAPLPTPGASRAKPEATRD